MGKYVNLIGEHFGRLTVVEEVGRDKFGEKLWLCNCICGNTKTVPTSRLRQGHCTSCGCYQKECISKIHKKHGLFGTRLYNSWSSMVQRCTNPNNPKYKNYGKRGISICNEWRNSFKLFSEWAFQNGYADNLTLDRIDVNGNYEPSNCRWIGIPEQENNRTNNVFITINGITKTRTEWSRINGINPQLACARVRIGWNEIDAVTKPVKHIKRKGEN